MIPLIKWCSSSKNLNSEINRGFYSVYVRELNLVPIDLCLLQALCLLTGLTYSSRHHIYKKRPHVLGSRLRTTGIKPNKNYTVKTGDRLFLSHLSYEFHFLQDQLTLELGFLMEIKLVIYCDHNMCEFRMVRDNCITFLCQIPLQKRKDNHVRKKTSWCHS